MPMPGGEEWSEDRSLRRITKAWLHHLALTADPAYDGARVLEVRRADEWRRRRLCPRRRRHSRRRSWRCSSSAATPRATISRRRHRSPQPLMVFRLLSRVIADPRGTSLHVHKEPTWLPPTHSSPSTRPSSKSARSFIDHLLEQAVGRDLNEHESELITKNSDRMASLNKLIGPLQESAKVSAASRERMADIQAALAMTRNPARRSPRPSTARPAPTSSTAGRPASASRTPASVSTCSTVPRLTRRPPTTSASSPSPSSAPLLNFIDTSRPIVNALGVTPMPGGRFVIPRVTQHTDTGLQSAEKAELVSRKMLIDRISVSMRHLWRVRQRVAVKTSTGRSPKSWTS